MPIETWKIPPYSPLCVGLSMMKEKTEIKIFFVKKWNWFIEISVLFSNIVFIKETTKNQIFQFCRIGGKVFLFSQHLAENHNHNIVHNLLRQMTLFFNINWSRIIKITIITMFTTLKINLFSIRSEFLIKISIHKTKTKSRLISHNIPFWFSNSQLK